MEATIAEMENSYSYEITEGSCGAEGCEGVTVYGIIMHKNGEKVAAVDDVSSVRAVVEKLRELCVRNKLMPENLLEVIEDYLD